MNDNVNNNHDDNVNDNHKVNANEKDNGNDSGIVDTAGWERGAGRQRS